MRTFSAWAFCVLFILLGSGCKRIVYCKNTCHTCYYPHDPSVKYELCNTDMEPYQYKEHMKVYEMSGYTCKETLPSKLYKVQGNPKEVSETVKAIQSGGMDCYDKARYDPDYFDYEKFKVNQQNCQACYDTIAKHYLRAYFDTLAVYSNGFCAECVGPGFQFGALPGMIAYASSKVEYMHCGYANAPKNTLNIGLIFKSLQYDTSLAQDEKDNWVKLNNWVDFNPIVMEGFKAPIFRECREPWW